VRSMRRAAVFGSVTTVVVLGALSLTTGLGMAGWLAGLAAGWTTTALLGIGRIHSGTRAILPPDWVTLTRALLAAGVAALVADSFGRPLPVVALIVLAAVALVLDAVDGPVARRTGTATPFGARFDGEVDAFLILVLSVAVARDYGGWVLAIGLARYVLLVAGWAIRWLAAPLPFRYWGKVVAAVQGIVLAAAATGWLPRLVGMLAVGAALVLLTESFGRSVAWLYRTGAPPRARTVVRAGTALLAGAVLWAALVAPDRLGRLTPAAFARIPVEGLALVAVGLLLPRRPRRVVAAVAGLALGLLTVVKVFDAGFYANIGRPFDPLLDWGSLPPAIGVVRDSIGAGVTDVLVVLVALALLLLVALVTASAIRVSTVTARHRRRSAGGVAVLGVVWAVSVALSLQLVPGTPLASRATADLAAAKVRNSTAALADRQRLAAAISAPDPYADIPSASLLSGLRGKDVIVAFVESYGQVAVQGTTFSDGVDAVLRRGTATLARAGYSARSAWLDSPTFGGISWLAHSTLQSGLWIDSQRRYDQLVASQRFTLSDAFGKAGWRTVSDIPSDDEAWPAGTSFYHYDRLYDRRDVGYHGPAFSYASMPDQYSLAAFQRLELQAGHRSVMAEIDLVSSHIPWTPLPHLVPWDRLGDGSIFDGMPAQGLTPAVAWRDRETVRRLYGQSIQYSLQSLVQWVTRLHDDNLVLLVLGDHQPWNEVSGDHANHVVPVSVVTSDPAVLARTDSWQWEDGLLPSPAAPMWPMDAFRNRFLDAFSIPVPTAFALPPSR
jgi:phosphatidylglycerophosphate synthase